MARASFLLSQVFAAVNAVVDLVLRLCSVLLADAADWLRERGDE